MAISEANRAALASIDHDLGRIEAEKAALDAEQAALDAKKAALDDKARTLKMRRANIHNSSTPAYSIPNELLSAIFKAGHSENPGKLEVTPFELIVSQVSCRWREMSLSMPSLWTRIRRRPYQAHLTAIEVYLQRSKKISFELIIRVGVPCDDTSESDEDSDMADELDNWPYDSIDKPDFDDVSEFCALIVPSMGRCNRMHLSFSIEPEPKREQAAYQRSGDIPLRIIMQHFHSLPAPVLRSIEVDPGDGVILRSESSQRIFTGGAPLLRSIQIRQIGMHICVPPLSSVQSIHLHLPNSPTRATSTCQAFCDILSAATSLQHLMVIGNIVDAWTSLANVTLPSLQTLSIGVRGRKHFGSHDSEPQFSGLLNTITAPSLKLLLMQSVDKYTFRNSPPPV